MPNFRTSSSPPERRSVREGAEWLTVTEVARLMNDVLETAFPVVHFEGEISQIQRAQSGHVYFTVKDAGAQVSCVMWASSVKNLKFRPDAGVLVRCQGKPNVYPASGRLQVIVHSMTPSGEGELQRRFLELKAKLERDGFFSIERKRPLPFLPKGVGIVTSKTGAVIHDMMVKLTERMPTMPVYLVDTRVQGEGAAQEIARAIDYLASTGHVDVIIVARGGGSLEDLWAFNEEEVVKAVFRCPVPVISGVGHEVDVTLCDLVSDIRAPTPTAAAEMVVPRRSDLLAALDDYRRRLTDTDRWFLPLTQRVDELSLRLDTFVVRVREEGRLRIQAAEARLKTIRPEKVIVLLRAKVSLLREQLAAAGRHQIGKISEKMTSLEGRLSGAAVQSRVADMSRELQRLDQRLKRSTSEYVARNMLRLEGAEARFEAVSPQRVLERGFAVITKGDRMVPSSNELASGDEVTIRFSDGKRDANIK